MPHDKLTGWKGDFWKRLDPPNDPIHDLARRDAGDVRAGQNRQYSNPGIAMWPTPSPRRLEDGRRKTSARCCGTASCGPSACPTTEWSVGYGKTFTVDGLPLVGVVGRRRLHGRAAARVGRLMLRGGDWEGERLLSGRRSGDHARRRHARQRRDGLVDQHRGPCPELPRTRSGRGAGRAGLARRAEPEADRRPQRDRLRRRGQPIAPPIDSSSPH